MTGDVVVLLYHALAVRTPGPLEVTVDAFRAQLRALVRRGYRPSTFFEAVTGGRDLPLFAVTFDDACGHVVELAAPELRRLGLPATVFVPVGYVDDGRALAWSQLRDLAADGWEIGSHGVTHRPLVELNERELYRELSESRTRVEQMVGRPCLSLAYPFGSVDGRVVRAAAAVGYRAAATTGGTLAPRTPLLFPRVGVGRLDNAVWFRLKTSPTVRRLRGKRGARPAVAVVRRVRSLQERRMQT